ncbi:hypothetical protein C2R22_08220 [Salinigranum rubrum]|uniref:Nucleotidyltransferase family protein n=1 Tax=Salinigranum rubrum TaxID=755307 RepID=A0A2I8VI99_9EURY|nr:nucleotidyltransferase family protein [Salinigranum rubrum]AUV81640.1 hypothetical protein C2R22_08220 [Salinigranum rubrum]
MTRSDPGVVDAAATRSDAPATAMSTPAATDGTDIPDAHGRAAVDLVRCLARPTPSGDERADAVALARESDPKEVLAAASALGVGPLVCTHVENGGEAFPAALRDQTGEYRRRMMARSLHLLTALHAILDAFGASGVRALAYKGPVLATVAYGDVGGRAFSDLDLFVPREDLPAAATALADLGFALDPEDPTRFSPADVARGGHVVRPPAEFRFVRHDGVVVELRWRLGSRVRPFPLTFDDCWNRRVDVVVGGRSVPTFGHEDRLLVLARHGAKHHWNRLGWAVDVAALLTRVDVDWPVVEARADALGARRVLAACVLLAAETADAPVPPLVLARARADPRVRTVVADAVTDYDTEPLTAAFGVDGPRARIVDALLCDSRRAWLLYRLRLGFEPQEVDAETVPLPRALHRLYHVVRPLRLASALWRPDTEGRERR